MKPSRILCLVLLLALLLAPAGCITPTTAPTAAPPAPTAELSPTSIPEAKMVMFVPWKNTSTDADLALVKQAIEDYIKPSLNLKLDFIVVPTDGSLEVLNTYLAGGEQLDAVTMNIGDAGTYLSQGGLILPLDDLLQQYGQDLLKNIPDQVWPMCKDVNKNIVYIPDYYQWIWQGAVIRVDWLEECGLSMPTTLAELENVMAAFKAKYPDKLPASGLPWFQEPYLMNVVTDGKAAYDMMTINDKGEYVPSMTLPEYKNMLALYRKWIDNGWYNPEFISGSDDTEMQLWNSGKIGICFCDPHRAIDWNWDAFIAANPTGKPDFIPPLKDENGVASYPFQSTVGVGRVVWISQKSQIPDRIVKFFNMQVAEPELYFLGKLGIKDKHWVPKDGQWALPEGVNPDQRPYADIFAPLAWEFMDQKMPGYSDRPLDSAPRTLHKRLNDSFFSAKPILTGTEGFTPDSTPVSQYQPISLADELMTIAAGTRPLDDFEKIVQQWLDTGGKEITAEYTRQFNEWKSK